MSKINDNFKIAISKWLFWNGASESKRQHRPFDLSKKTLDHFFFLGLFIRSDFRKPHPASFLFPFLFFFFLKMLYIISFLSSNTHSNENYKNILWIYKTCIINSKHLFNLSKLSNNFCTNKQCTFTKVPLIN